MLGRIKTWLDSKDWPSIIAHYKIFTNNSDVVKELGEKPIKLYIAFILIADWALLRIDALIAGGWEAIRERLLFILLAAIGLPLYIRFQYKLGRTKFVRAIQNATARQDRTVNDMQWGKLFDNVEDIKEKQREIERKIK